MKLKEVNIGFESFLIKLEGGSKSVEEAIEVISGLENVKPDDESLLMPGSHYFLLKDGRHAIEMEVMADPVRVSCRFTLCHPPSVDAVFFQLAHFLMETLQMEVTICDDALPEHEAPFPLERFDEFAQASARCIGVRRSEWRSAFGNQQMGAKTNEAHQHFILPHCQPYAEKAG